MELDIQRFLQNPDQQLFEFQHFPTSYLRLAAHRVAQHYGLITMVQDGQVNKILVQKTSECRYPAVRLSEIPAKQSGGDTPEMIKLAIKPRPNKGSINDPNGFGIKRNPMRSVEERKEEYDRARARIFSSPSSPTADDTLPQLSSDSKDLNFKDREKDRTDPDYDRSYERYVRSLPANQSFSLTPFNMQKIPLPYMQYDPGFPQLGQMPRTQASLGYHPAANPAMSPFCPMGSNQTSRDAAYVQWPSTAMMYAHSYEQFRHVTFQAPYCQQPLSFDYSQNH
ncbi:CAMP-REGULATED PHOSPHOPROTEIN 21 RELATED R3H DOMAIN CONTAINING PROTEIN [Salix koriyanagi]|uniref:cAMP-REGULATED PHOSPHOPROTEIN 21 RELATED R3H DOMAIN CONTAINING PROTEIN n=1 Tax=Salix koriyanagi TaxID=2511006 RepID=A0A9Q0X413_9ROSI|nr:CAMP-REGULATED PHOSPHOPROTEIN 21 RELATED R3H DOMAIN CONTAINING PROTEIN [Salix koriyanagi]